MRKSPDESGRITEAAFTELLLAYAGYAPKKKSRITKRVKKTLVPGYSYNSSNLPDFFLSMMIFILDSKTTLKELRKMIISSFSIF